jgi:serine/threonine-protein kinase PknG
VSISIEAKLRLANSFIDRGHIAASDYTEAEMILEQVAIQDAWDWRVDWYRGKSLLAQNRHQEAQAAFDRVYFDLPGELAPKLAFAIAAELSKNYVLAAQM